MQEPKTTTDKWQMIFTGPGVFWCTGDFVARFDAPAPDDPRWPYIPFKADEVFYLESGRTLYARYATTPGDLTYAEE